MHVQKINDKNCDGIFLNDFCLEWMVFYPGKMKIASWFGYKKAD